MRPVSDAGPPRRFHGIALRSRQGVLEALGSGRRGGRPCVRRGRALRAVPQEASAPPSYRGFETDAGLAAVLKSSLNFLSGVLSQEGLIVETRVVTEDFLLRNAGILGAASTLFHASETPATFDAVISNPPYFKLPKSDPRARATAEIVHGQPNIYALFMAVSAQLLAPQGQLFLLRR